ncbi:MAG: hypothetical protein CMP68_02815 [Flavobacteriales bacterium]|nr:hypothetical protein [Flavobacteriales bacterium]|tara:strand:+ start:6928 stop:7815 length:888 start_codon:yes stop_codon:yes gene_type:complete
MKKSKLDRFFKITICFSLSFAFWSLNKISKKQIKNLSFKVYISDLPENLVLDSISTQKINLKVKGNSIANIKQKTIKISANNKDEKLIFIDKKEIENQLETNLEIIDVFPDSIYLFTSKKTIKKIPIKHNIEFNLEKNHWIKDKINIEPESVIIKGNTKDLEKFKYIETKYLNLGSVIGKVEGEIEIVDNILLENYGKVQYSFETQKFTEGVLNLKVEAINFPKNKEVLLFPKKIKIKYLVAENKFHKINEDDFKVVFDFNKININSKKGEITISKKPNDIIITELNKKIDFIIQ